MCQTKVNVLTCEYIDFWPASVSQVFCLVKLLICKSQCSHMWVHWPKCLKISFLSKRYLISFVISYCLFVVFNNANAVSAEMWVWGFGNHAWNKSLLSSHSSATRDLTRLLYHLWFPKPHTHISALTALALLKTTNKRYEQFWSHFHACLTRNLGKLIRNY